MFSLEAGVPPEVQKFFMESEDISKDFSIL
jgi:hypothetical protein